MVKYKKSPGDRLFNFFNTLFLTFIFLAIFYPMIYIVSSSFSSTQAVAMHKVWLFPVDFSLEGYKAVFNNAHILSGYYNSALYTLAGTFINVTLTILIAYPLSRPDLFGKNLIMYFITFTMIFSGGLVPTYILVSQLGMLNTRWAMLIPNAISVWNVIITRTYYQTTISQELMDSAKIDGCDDVRFLWKIVIPLSAAITAVITLFYAVGHWNSFFNALIYLNKQELYPLQIVLRDILVMNKMDAEMFIDYELVEKRQNLAELLKFSLIVVANIPVMCIYPFVQKYFVKGIMVGSIKG